MITMYGIPGAQDQVRYFEILDFAGLVMNDGFFDMPTWRPFSFNESGPLGTALFPAHGGLDDDTLPLGGIPPRPVAA